MKKKTTPKRFQNWDKEEYFSTFVETEKRCFAPEIDYDKMEQKIEEYFNNQKRKNGSTEKFKENLISVAYKILSPQIEFQQGFITGKKIHSLRVDLSDSKIFEKVECSPSQAKRIRKTLAEIGIVILFPKSIQKGPKQYPLYAINKNLIEFVEVPPKR